MVNGQNCIIANGAPCEVLSIWWRPILNCAVYRYRNFIRNHMIGFTVWQKTVYTFFWQFLLILECHLNNFDFKSQETNQTKILRKLWYARLQIGVEGVKGDKGTLTYPPVFFLPLVFKNSSQSFIEYSDVTFSTFDPVLFLLTGYHKTHKDDTVWCMQWHQEVIAKLIALYCINFH